MKAVQNATTSTDPKLAYDKNATSEEEYPGL